jgi:hypothetical protein
MSCGNQGNSPKDESCNGASSKVTNQSCCAKITLMIFVSGRTVIQMIPNLEEVSIKIGWMT